MQRGVRRAATMITNQTFLTRGGAKYEWVDLEKSSPDEVAAKATKYHIHPIAVREILDKGERPRIQDFENHTFIVLQPLTRKDGKLEFGELKVVLSRNGSSPFTDNLSRK